MKDGFKAGDVVGGNYVLGDVLGVGGMGIVHAAVQRSLERTVAVKLPRAELADDKFVRERFHCEALAASKLSHPNIVRVLDYGDDRGGPYLVMEQVIGPRLSQVLQDRGTLPVDIAVEVIAQIVEGLEDAHAKGIVHADLKLDNVLVETLRDGTTMPRLIDFGIAHFVGHAHARPLGEPVITGTPDYVAPEVVRGATPTFASDVYAIGVMLYELVTGAPPFTGGPATSVMCRKLESDAAPMTWRCPELDIPPEIDELVTRALSRDPARRFENATQLGRALARVLANRARVGLTRQTFANVAFSTEAATANMTPSPTESASSEAATPIVERRLQVIRAINECDGDGIAVAYLDLARALIEDHQPASAISELEEGAELLSFAAPSAPAWRLLITLAALYDGNGDRARACKAAHGALMQATSIDCVLGRERAARLCARLARSRASTRRAW